MASLVQFGVRYSPNLGDGIISECLVHALTQLHPGIEIVSLDMAGRTAYGEKTLPARTFLIRALRVLPAWLRLPTVERLLGRQLDQVEPVWRRAIRGADLVVIGGGQIFSDADLNFCLKIAQIARLAKEEGVPCAVHGVGVSRNWSARGTRLFGTLAETDLRFVGVRDGFSIGAWADQWASALRDLPAAQSRARELPSGVPVLTRDPGLLCHTAYPVDRGKSTANAASARPVGLCIADPVILNYHADSGVAGGADGIVGFFAAAIAAICRNGRQVALFCNGAVEDQATIRKVVARAEVAALLRSGQANVAAVSRTPRELAEMISGMSCVVAHRLHASIIAYSYGIPAIGLAWDRKVEGFFASVERSDFMLGAEAKPEAVADLVERAIATGIDAGMHARVIDETWNGLRTMLEASGVSPARLSAERVRESAGAGDMAVTAEVAT